MTTKPGTIALLLFGMICSSSCGDESVTTGAWAEFRAELTFSGDTLTVTQAVNPDQRPEMLEVKGELICGGLDFSASSIGLLGFDGTSGETFTLSGTLLDGNDAIPMFEWTGELEPGAGEVSFGNNSVNLKQEALNRLSEIMVRAKNNYEVRYEFQSASSPNFVKVLVVQRLRVATEQGTCPPTQL